MVIQLYSGQYSLINSLIVSREFQFGLWRSALGFRTGDGRNSSRLWRHGTKWRSIQGGMPTSLSGTDKFRLSVKLLIQTDLLGKFLIWIWIICNYRSAEYDETAQTCRMSREDRRTQPMAFRRDGGSWDYLENQCVKSQFQFIDIFKKNIYF